jgi:CMP-N-acetylneuraminic acid synthetase
LNKSIDGLLQNMKILAVISARGGSKGVPNKNIRPLNGKPLIYWTIKEALLSKFITRTIVSSDSPEIIKIANSFGCETPFKRRKDLALDTTASIDVVLDAVEKCPGYDWVILLQPTSPFRKACHIDGAIERTLLHNAKSCVSVVMVEENPHWMYKINVNFKLEKIIDENIYQRRQDLPKIFRLNGAIYFSKISRLINERTFVDKDTISYEMSQKESIDIDTEYDLKLSQDIFKLSI